MTATIEAPALVTPTAYQLANHPDRTPEWFAARRSGIGGSDVAAILGMDKYSSPLKVYLDKRGELPDLPKSPELEEAARWGQILEGPIAEEWAARTGHQLQRSLGTLAHIEHPWMLVNLDGTVTKDGATGVYEGKNRSAWQMGEWEDGVPDAPALQAHWGMAVTGYPFAYAAALVGGNRLMWHRIDRDESLVEHLRQIVGDFWRDNVLAGVEPPMDGLTATTELLAHLWDADEDSVTTADPAEVDRLITGRAAAKALIKEQEGQLRLIENRLKRIAGEHEVVQTLGETAFTWKRVISRRLDTKALKADHPDIYDDYARESASRRLHVPKEKTSE